MMTEIATMFLNIIPIYLLVGVVVVAIFYILDIAKMRRSAKNKGFVFLLFSAIFFPVLLLAAWEEWRARR